MKKQTIKGLAFIVAAGSMATSCDLLKDLQYEVTPKTLEMHGDSVRVSVDVNFPVKGIRKKVSAEITPLLGTTALKTITFQGEKVTGNANVIQFKPGGKITYTDIIAYKPEFEDTQLKVTGSFSKGGKVKGAIPVKKIAEGTIVTPFLVNKDFKVILEKDAFTRVTEKGFTAQINFDKGKSIVKPTELKEKDIADLKVWLEAANSNPKITIKSISVVGYASPEGEVGSNDTLSNERATAAKSAVLGVALGAKNDKIITEMFSLAGRGEDFDGFKKELVASSMNNDEKQLIIRVLEMQKDPVTRETEMRNMGKTFTFLEQNIFTKLRRSEIVVTYDKSGYTDEELVALSVSKPETLNIEELLYTATLTNDLNEKLRIYKLIELNFPTDQRGANNVGAIFYMQNKLQEAKAEFEKANGIKDNSISKNNLGAIAGSLGDREGAKKILDQAKGAGSEVNYNLGILNIQDGLYNEAVSNFGTDNSFNKALAQLLSATAAGSDIKTLDDSADKESAQGFYLRAIAAARQDNIDSTISNLKNSFAKDGSFKDKAVKDKEFLKYAENPNFSGAVK
jgi:outer membrane protein OmpA-like peptidoglycan-associated protein/tetratricopeptide (TPR) repeat protein